jgi:hypothetical protein
MSLFAAAGGALGPDPDDPDPGEVPHWPEQPAGDDKLLQPHVNPAAISNAKQTMSRTFNLRISVPQ